MNQWITGIVGYLFTLWCSCEHSLDPKWIPLRKPKLHLQLVSLLVGPNSGEQHKQDPECAQRDMLDSPISGMTCPFSLPILWLMTSLLHSFVQYLLNKRCWTGDKELIISVQDNWQGFHLMLKTHIVLSKLSLGPPFPSNYPTLSKSTFSFFHSPKEKSWLKNPTCQVDWGC